MTQKGDDFLAAITAAELPTPAWDGQAGDLQATLVVRFNNRHEHSVIMT